MIAEGLEPLGRPDFLLARVLSVSIQNAAAGGFASIWVFLRIWISKSSSDQTVRVDGARKPAQRREVKFLDKIVGENFRAA